MLYYRESVQSTLNLSCKTKQQSRGNDVGKKCSNDNEICSLSGVINIGFHDFNWESCEFLLIKISFISVEGGEKDKNE